MTERKFAIMLTIVCEDESDDPRRWPFDELLAAPDGEPDRYVSYIAGYEVMRPA